MSCERLDDLDDRALPRLSRECRRPGCAEHGALVDHDDLHLDALARAAAPTRARMRSASSRNTRPSVAPALTSSGVVSTTAPMTPTRTPLTVKTADGAIQPVGRLAGRLVDDVGGEEREVGPLLVGQQPLDAEVELVVAEARGVEAPGVLDVDRRHVLEQRRVRRRGADVVAGGQQQGLARQATRPPRRTSWPAGPRRRR